MFTGKLLTKSSQRSFKVLKNSCNARHKIKVFFCIGKKSHDKFSLNKFYKLEYEYLTAYVKRKQVLTFVLAYFIM